MTSPVFDHFSAADRQRILRRVKRVNLSANEIIIREGVPGKGFYLVVRGSVEVAKFAGEALTHLATLGTGSVFGEISLMRHVPTSATVRAKQDSECLFLSRDDFQELANEKPEIQAELDQLCDQRLEEQKTRLAQSSHPFPPGIFVF